MWWKIQVLVTCMKANRIAITISEDEYNLGLEACRHNLHGRILWPKGSSPTTVVRIRGKLASQRPFIAKWGITSLQKGFHEFTFSSLEDAYIVRSIRSWNLNPSILKLFFLD